MPTQGPGARSTRVSPKATTHGTLCVIEGIVGSAFKVDQVGWQTTPADAVKIAQDEEIEIEVGGILETPATGGLAAADTGDLVWINPTTWATTTVKATGLIPVGVVEGVRTKHGVLNILINANAWQAFLPAA